MSPKKVTLVYALLLLGIYSISALELRSQSLDLGGSARGYIFFRLEDLPDFIDLRRDTEFTSFRFTLDSEFNPSIRFEAHGVLDFLSPRGSGAARIAQSRTSTYLPLDSILNESDSHLLTSRFDRLNLQFKINDVRLIVGRQAISWGVAHFWPTVDFFSSFAPERIDRDYKDGVDAARAIVPLGDYSELQIIGAVLGPSFEKDGSAAAQLRFHMGTWDLGMVGGSFHGDTVAGVFITTGSAGNRLSWRGHLDAIRRRRRPASGPRTLLAGLTRSGSSTDSQYRDFRGIPFQRLRSWGPLTIHPPGGDGSRAPGRDVLTWPLLHRRRIQLANAPAGDSGPGPSLQLE